MFPITHLETCLIDQITDRDKALLKGVQKNQDEIFAKAEEMGLLEQPLNGKATELKGDVSYEESERNYVSDLNENDSKLTTEEVPFKPQYVWKNVILFVILHVGGLWGLGIAVSYKLKWLTAIFTFFIGWLSVEVTMIGAHRFYSHKAFKGTYWFRVLVIFLHAMAGQNSLYIWVRDHRLHHKYSDTDADPHNSLRGFFFCHMGWLMQRKHPMVKLKGKTIDMSDLEADPLVQFQRKYYYILYAILAFAIPVFVPVYLFGEPLKNAILCCYFLRYMISLHGTWTVNSFAHYYGYRPYTKDIQPVESEFVAFISSGEGWHNYHHTFPWDYRAGEFGKKWNFTAKMVDYFASIGMVYDLKSATPEMVVTMKNGGVILAMSAGSPYSGVKKAFNPIRHRALKRGDGTHPYALEEADINSRASEKSIDNDVHETLEDKSL